MKRSDLLLEIRRLLKDTDTNPSINRWPDADLIARADTVQNEMAAMTDIIESRITDGLDSGVAEYDLPSTYIHDKAAFVLNDNSVWVPLTRKSEKELDNESPAWRNSTSFPPKYYYIRRGNKFGVTPYPDKTKASSLRIDFYRYPDQLADGDGDTVPLNGEYKFIPFHQIICFGVARLCKMDEQDWANVDKFEDRYAMGLVELKRVVSNDNEDIRIPNVYEQGRHRPRRTR